MDIIETIKQLAGLGVDGGLAILVYLLARDAARTRVALIECLQSGGKLTEKTLDTLDDIG